MEGLAFCIQALAIRAGTIREAGAKRFSIRDNIVNRYSKSAFFYRAGYIFISLRAGGWQVYQRSSPGPHSRGVWSCPSPTGQQRSPRHRCMRHRCLCWRPLHCVRPRQLALDPLGPRWWRDLRSHPTHSGWRRGCCATSWTRRLRGGRHRRR